MEQYVEQIANMPLSKELLIFGFFLQGVAILNMKLNS